MKLSHSYSSIKMYENCPLRYYKQRVLKEITDTGGDASVYGERIHKFLEDRLRENAALPQEAVQYETLCKSVEAIAEGGELHIERELVLNENLEPTGWWDADAWLRSKLDILVVNGDTAVVMDWKTGKRRPDFFQMELFAAQVFKHFPQVIEVKTSLVWLKTLEMDTEEYKVEYVNQIWEKIISKIRRIHQSLEHETWPAKPSGLCPYCPAKHICEFAKV